MTSRISLLTLTATLTFAASSLTAPPVYAGSSFAKGVAGGIIGAAIYNGIKNSNSQRSREPRRSSSRRTVRHSTKKRAPRRPSQAVVQAKQIQTALVAAGFYHGAIDGKLNSFDTKSAILQFQHRYGLPATGILSPQEKSLLQYQASLAELNAHLNYMGYDKRGKGRQLQAALKVEGFYTTKIDGVIGRGSRQAISLYQQSRGMASTGGLLPDQEAALIASAKQKIQLQRQQSEQQLAQLGASMRPAQQPAFRQRLAWLRQIAREENQ
jgi:peptidoglycan hydrolase-like protein with peptidoglycan-binding domain